MNRPPEISAGNDAAEGGGSHLHAFRLTHCLASAKRGCKTGGMSRELVNEMCAAQPGALWSDPWGGGHDCWKVGGKIFALIGVEGTHVSVKTSGVEIAELLIQTGVAERAPYLHRSWVSVDCEAPRDELEHRIRQSYLIIRASLPKKVQAALAPAG